LAEDFPADRTCGEGMAGLTQRGAPSRIFGREVGSNLGKSGRMGRSAGASPLCPQCGSNKVWRDGLRYSLFGERIQRWFCRNCGFRFSDSDDVQRGSSMSQRLERVDTKSLKGSANTLSNRQICVTETKNLAAEIQEKEVPRRSETKPVGGLREIDKTTAKGLLLQFGVYLDKEGYDENSHYVHFIRMLLNSKCNVYDPEAVKEAIAKKKWKDGTKMLCTYAYDAFTRMAGLSWLMPTYHQEEYVFFLPDETELDALINATRSQRMRTYLQTLKEIWADPSEGLGLRWIDIDQRRCAIAINKPVKDHRPRELEVTPRLIAMINTLPRKSKLVFPMTYATMYGTFKKLRKRVAHNTQNPRILSIKPNSFRHWGGTMLAWLTNGNAFTIQRKLGLKKLENVSKYVARVEFNLNQDFEVVTATTDEEIKKYGESGYQKYDERTVGGTHISYYRRPKRFGSLKA
jgi:hypothetical protein